MATPLMTVESRNFAFSPVTTAVQCAFSGTAKDQDGVAIDISSGYTVRFGVAAIPDAILLVPTTDFTATYGADGEWVATLNATGVAKLPNGSKAFSAYMSNDATATLSECMKGTVSTSRLVA